MAVSLLAIQFNHDPSAATHDALNIRVDATGTVNIPEWTAGRTETGPSPAAYAIAEVGGNGITVQAQFETDAPLTFVEVRALFATGDASKTPLGNLAATRVSFDEKGASGWVSFPCSSGLGTTVRVEDIEWRWQFRTEAEGSWTDLATTRHRIYVLLGVPTLPWQQTPFDASNLQLPWTEVLDVACAWAASAPAPDAAAALITGRVYALGPATMTYDCAGGGATHYANAGMFNCTAFLDLVKGGPGNGPYINCTDCATFTSTFANALGCDLWQSRMEKNFYLNEILAIGSDVWQTACDWGYFIHHEVAWKNECAEDDAIFDACLQVDGSEPLGGALQVPLLPANLVFGATGSGQFRDRLCTVEGRPNCNPNPASRRRRPVF